MLNSTESEIKDGKEEGKGFLNSFSAYIKNHKKIVIGSLIFLGILLIIYIGMTIYFMNHFYFGSSLNSIDISGKSVEEVNELMATELKKYELTLIERDGINEQITPDEIGLSYDSGSGFEDSKEKQSPYKWISSIFNSANSKMLEGVKYDEKLLKRTVDNLSCFDSTKVIEPVNPTFKYVDGGYEIVPEINGNKVDKDILYKHISEAILNGQVSVNLEEIDCYYKPQYTAESEKVTDTHKLLNKYVATKVTYDLGSAKEVLEGSTLSQWISFDENYEVTLNEEEVKNYVINLANEYNTVGKKRSFKTSAGATINVGGGDYGWSIDKTKETQALIEAIKIGEVASKQPAFYRTAMVLGKNDIGNTYVEINLTSQHLWFYKNGSLVVHGPVVTGNVSANNSTPAGIYKLKYKQKDATLHGDDYETKVSYWMPFNGGIGIHDAYWRSEFGGDIYQTSGSHGCVNSPYDLAQAVYNNIRPGVPVVCYH